MESAPPPPSIVSAPDPPRIVLAALDPVRRTPELADRPEASMLSNPVTLAMSPTVWSDAARLTVRAFLRIRVSLPTPPSRQLSVP